MASKTGTTPKRTRKSPRVSSIDTSPEKVELTVSQIRDDMCMLEELRKKSGNISGRVSGQMREAIIRVEEGLVLLTAKASEAEKLKKRVDALQMENYELMAKHCTYAVRANPVASENGDENGNTGSAEPDAKAGAGDVVPKMSLTSAVDSERDSFRDEFRKLREFVAKEIRSVREERKAVPGAKKTYASCVKKAEPTCVDPVVGQTAGSSKPAVSEKSTVRENVKAREKAPYNPPIVIRIRGIAPYTEMIAKIKSSVNPATYNISVLSLRRTPAGEAEFRLGGSTLDAIKFEEAIKACLGNDGTIRKIQPMSYIHISDLEQDITEDAIISDVRKICGIGADDIKVSSIRPAYGGTMKASVKLPKRAAEFLQNAGRTIIGYVACRCRIRDLVTRCFRCGDTGHFAAKCTGPDKTGRCFCCGSETHRIAECQEKKRHEDEKMDTESRRSPRM